MRKLYLFLSLSIDGRFEGANHDISWHHIDDETNKFALEQLRQTDLYLWGRRVYQLMEGYWPMAEENPSTSVDDREIAHLLNTTKKIVYSRTLASAQESGKWRNVVLARDVDVGEIKRLKDLPGKDIGVGGSNLAVTLLKAGLIDELRFMIIPVVVCEGTTVFSGFDDKHELELLETRKFASGNVLVRYRPKSVT
ncbi:MAG TPA: dihydrofolate reductase family protein [Methanomassiliicoccales archaeon]|nr:dihydrofolate reductase family protein [Methanomassiliicoccales archaeon]